MTAAHDDEGVFAILYAALIVAMFGMAAIVVDLGQLRADKRESRSAADTAVLAAAADLGIGPYDPLKACRTALAFTIDNLRLGTPTPSTAPADPCAALDPDGPFVNPTASCPLQPNSASAQVVGTGVMIKVTWPVPAGSFLLTQPDGKPGSSPRPSDPAFDGTASGCDRLGIAITRTRSFGLSAALGASNGVTSARSVARATFDSGGGDLFYPLVILDPISCYGLNITGGTKVLVKNKNDIPGRIGLDSNGTATSNAGNSDSCGPGSAVIVDADGTNGLIEARPGSLGSTAAIEIFGPDSMPAKAFQSSDIPCAGTNPCVRPKPTVSQQRITRLPFDKLFNCASTCPDGSPEKAYVDRFGAQATAMTAVSAAASGWTVITGSACNTPPPAGALRYFVNCNPYKVGGVYVFPAGATVIIKGDLVVENAGCLVINADASPCATAPSTSPSPTYLPTNGMLSVLGDVKSTGAGPRMFLPQTFLHQPIISSRFNGGFGGVISWSAPFVDPALASSCPSGQPVGSIPPVGCFRNLAFWTEAPSGNTSPAVITGGGVLRLEGTFFLGNAKLKLSGGSLIDVENAQFVAKRIEATGGSLLTFIPNAERTTPVPRRGVTLVR